MEASSHWGAPGPISRREFVGRAAAAGAAGMLFTCDSPVSSVPSGLIPRRSLGRTGLSVSILSLGGGGAFMRNAEGDWQVLLERAIALGVNYFDTAAYYQWNYPRSSEEMFGDILPFYRSQAHVCTKMSQRDPDAGKAEFERSLTRLNMGCVDVLLIHNIGGGDEVSAIESGIYRTAVSFKEQGMAKNIGFSSMSSADRSKELLEALDFDVVEIAMNATGFGGFEDKVLPVARAKEVGVVAMKIMSGLVGVEAMPRELLHNVLSKNGVTTALIGHESLEMLEENAQIAREYSPGPAPVAARRELENRLARLNGPHALCWARPDYFDGKNYL